MQGASAEEGTYESLGALQACGQVPAPTQCAGGQFSHAQPLACLRVLYLRVASFRPSSQPLEEAGRSKGVRMRSSVESPFAWLSWMFPIYPSI